MKKIKIAQVITRLDWGGAPDIVRIISGYLDKGAFEVTIISGLTLYPSVRTNAFLNDFSGEKIFVPSLGRDIGLFTDIRAFLKLYFLFKREKFDIVHTHTAKAGFLGRLAAKLAGVAVVIHTPHGNNFYGYFSPFYSRIIIWLERFCSYFTDKVIALTELERNELLRFKVIERKKIELVCQGLELNVYPVSPEEKSEIRKAWNINASDPVVGMVARLEEVKGPVYFLEAAKLVLAEFPATKFILAGEGSLRGKLESKALDLGINRNLIFTGWREDVQKIISLMDIAVLSSLNEAVGMALIEAQSQGVPVVATNVGGIPEVVKNSVTGILVEPRDSQALSRAIIGLLKDKETRLNMGRAAESWVRGKFKAEDMVDKLSGVYKQCLSRVIASEAKQSL